MPHTACEVPVTQTKAPSIFRKTAESFEPGAKSLPQGYFISPEVFAQEKRENFLKAMGAGGTSERNRPARGLLYLGGRQRKLDRCPR